MGQSAQQEIMAGNEPAPVYVAVERQTLDCLIEAAEIRRAQYQDAIDVISSDSFGDSQSENVPLEVFEAGEAQCRKMVRFYDELLESARDEEDEAPDFEDVRQQIRELYDALPLGRDGTITDELHDDICTHMARLCESLGFDVKDF